MADINISLGYALLEEEPDGQKCAICKETCWQNCYRVCMKGDTKLVKTEVVICKSCRRSYEEADNL